MWIYLDNYAVLWDLIIILDLICLFVLFSFCGEFWECATQTILIWEMFSPIARIKSKSLSDAPRLPIKSHTDRIVQRWEFVQMQSVYEPIAKCIFQIADVNPRMQIKFYLSKCKMYFFKLKCEFVSKTKHNCPKKNKTYLSKLQI